MSPRKMRVVANMVRGSRVQDAMAMCQLSPKKAAKIIGKVLKSAAANAEDRSGGEVQVDELRVGIQINGGTIIKRWMPRAMGRANRINHRTSHVLVTLTDEA